MTTPLKHGDTTRSSLLWIRPDEPLPARLSALVNSDGISRRVVVFGGGNKGLSDAIKAAMPDFFATVFEGFDGTAISGGTGQFDDNRNSTSFEITTVPVHLAQRNPCIAIGSTPVTAEPSLDHKHGSVGTDAYGGGLDPRHHANLVVATHPSQKALDWNGDLKQRFIFLDELLDQGYNVAYVICNGGDVTTEEIYRALDLTPNGLQLFVVEGSGREADKFVRIFRDGAVEDTTDKGKPLADDVIASFANSRANADRDNVVIVSFADAAGARAELIARDLVPAPAPAEATQLTGNPDAQSVDIHRVSVQRAQDIIFGGVNGGSLPQADGDDGSTSTV